MRKRNKKSLSIHQVKTVTITKSVKTVTITVTKLRLLHQELRLEVLKLGQRENVYNSRFTN